MSSAFFRGPGEDSSETDSSSDEADIEEPSTRNTDEHDSASIELELAHTESLPSNASFVAADTEGGEPVLNADTHRDNMFAALLEDYYKTRAAEFMNSTTAGAQFTRSSPEVQTLGRKLYSEASHTLVQSGIMPTSTTSGQRSRQNSQYLTALDSIAYKSMQGDGIGSAQEHLRLQNEGSNLALVRANNHGALQRMGYIEETMASVLTSTGRVSISSPHSDMALTLSHTKQHSHYDSSFQQLKLLGKGGFGKVYHAHSIFDRKEYAIKKIPLSPRLTLRYQQGGHQELESVLREVQALAQLDHSNVVRYHATWIEEPKFAPKPLPRMPSMTHQRLLADKPRISTPRTASPEPNDGIVFGFDSSRRPSLEHNHGWSIAEPYDHSTSVRESQLFTDGHVRASASTDSSLDDTVCVLHVQMSLYPMTLSQYLAPIPSNSTSPPGTILRRHCFHLVPSLRIILGILCGLQYIHAKGLIHRDIKPGNIFLSNNTDHSPSAAPTDGFYDVASCPSCPNTYSPYHINPRIGDFGLVAELARSEINIQTPHTTSPPSSPSKPVGTEYYRPPPPPPSHINDDRHIIDEKIDVYALGVILVELLWKCDTSSERMHVLKDLQRGKVPKSLVAVVGSEGHAEGTGEKVRECVRGMLERDSRQRWGCQRVKECVLEVLEGCREVQLERVRNLGGTEEDDDEGAAVARELHGG